MIFFEDSKFGEIFSSQRRGPWFNSESYENVSIIVTHEQLFETWMWLLFFVKPSLQILVCASLRLVCAWVLMYWLGTVRFWTTVGIASHVPICTLSSQEIRSYRHVCVCPCLPLARLGISVTSLLIMSQGWKSTVTTERVKESCDSPYVSSMTLFVSFFFWSSVWFFESDYNEGGKLRGSSRVDE